MTRTWTLGIRLIPASSVRTNREINLRTSDSTPGIRKGCDRAQPPGVAGVSLPHRVRAGVDRILEVNQRLLADANDALQAMRQIEDEQDDNGDERREKKGGENRSGSLCARSVPADITTGCGDDDQ